MPCQTRFVNFTSLIWAREADMKGAKRSGENPRKTVLLALLGKSSGVVTETVWALAHEAKAVIPDEVVVITTRPGADMAGRILLKQGAWEALRHSLAAEGFPAQGKLRFGSADSIRTLPRPDGRGDLDDLLTAEDNMAAADAMMRYVRSFTEDPEIDLIASLAGGRKTMAALLMACMCLLGRPQDRVCHVLVNPPYDRPDLAPLFLFPQPGMVHHLPGDSKSYPAEEARVELAEIPFVRVRSWYEKRFRTLPPSYMSLVRRVQENLQFSGYLPRLELRIDEAACRVDGVPVRLSASEFAFLLALIRRLKQGRDIEGWWEIVADFEQWRRLPREELMQAPQWVHDVIELRLDPKEDGRRLAYRLRKKFAGSAPDVGWWAHEFLTLSSPHAEWMKQWLRKRVRVIADRPGGKRGRPRDVTNPPPDG